MWNLHFGALGDAVDIMGAVFSPKHTLKHLRQAEQPNFAARLQKATHRPIESRNARFGAPNSDKHEATDRAEVQLQPQIRGLDGNPLRTPRVSYTGQPLFIEFPLLSSSHPVALAVVSFLSVPRSLRSHSLQPHENIFLILMPQHRIQLVIRKRFDC